MEDLHRAPLEREDEIGPAVAVDIRPGGGGHHPHVAQAGRKLVGDILEAPANVAVEEAAGRGGPLAGHDAAADEKVNLAVAVVVGRRARGRTFPVGRQRPGRSELEAAVAVAQVEAVVEPGITLVVSDAAGADQQIDMAVAVGVEEERADVVGVLDLCPGLAGSGRETAVRPAEEKRAGLPERAGDEDIVDPVAVHVGDRQGGRHLPEAARQQALAEELVHRLGGRGVVEAARVGILHVERAVGRRLENRRGAVRSLTGREFRFGYGINAVGREVLEHLHFAERPADSELLDGGVVAEAEVDEGKFAGDHTALGVELAHLHPRGGFRPELGANAVAVRRMAGELKLDAVAGGGVVPENGRRAVLIGEDEVEDAAVVEIHDGTAEGNAEVVETPGGGHILELQVAQVAVGEGALAARLGVLPDRRPRGERGRDILFVHEVRVDEVADHARGEKHVLAAVVVEVGDPRGPGPAGGIHAGEVRGFLVVVGAGVEIHGAPHVLGNEFGHALHLPKAAAGLLHAIHEALAGVVPHVGDEKVDQAVVVEVAGIGAHRKVGDVGQALVHDVDEGAVALVEVEAVGGLEIVGDVEVGPAVLVGVEPDGGVALGEAPDAGLVRDVGERAVAVVVKQVVAAPERTLREIEDVGDDIAVEVAIAVVVREGGHDGGILHIEPVLVGALGEGAVAVVDEQQVRGVVAADVEVGPAVLVDVHHGGADFGRGGIGTVDSGGGSDVHELERSGLPVERAGTILGDDKNVGPTVAIEVGHGDTRLDGAEGELAEPVAPHARIIVDVGDGQTRLGRRQLVKAFAVRGWGMPRRQRPLLDDGGGSRGGNGRGYGQNKRKDDGAADDEATRRPGPPDPRDG